MGSPINDFEEVRFRVETAQKMVGSATITMDPESLQHATNAVESARQQLETMKEVSTDLDAPFLLDQEEKLEKCAHQLQEAKN
ncbi:MULTISPECIES: DUF2564 family protein [unclassified Bacillus (in: firmicutes)]|uniref:DUF2564 family protein n=1 Tax=unclassified Bacillus (in: firmicutes) TaxID=185979 RepID=UPI00232FD34E|nr:DUF2564 family protein [Bacillus sp. BP-3]MDC2865719.1 DUF2564 family protein [Bacillus sp. BP-3]